MKKWFSIQEWFPLIIGVCFGVCFGICLGIVRTAQAAGVDVEDHSNSNISIAEMVENPNQYFYGYVLSGEVFQHKKNIYTAIQVHPNVATTMYDSQITFCKNVEEKFNALSQQDLVVITYSKQPNDLRLCYTLFNVDIVHKAR